MAHNHCHHEFGFCAQCDVVYCKACKQEWGGHAHGYRWYPGGTYTQPYSAIASQAATVSDGDPSGDLVYTAGHSHN